MSLKSPRRDGGYAWIVLFAGFMLNVFTSGNFAILGVFLVEFLHHFRVAKATVTWIGALQMFVGNIAGLGLGPLIQLLGPRVVAMAGGFLITAGFLITGIWPTLPIIYTFYGACASIGFLAIHMSGMVAIQQYFVKRRALANGLFMAGFSIGTFALPPLVRIMIDRYSWQGAMIITAGVMMHSVFFGALLRPIARPKHSMISNPVEPPEKFIDDQEEKMQRKTFFRTHAPFMLFLMGFFFMQMGHMSVYIYTPLRCDAIGVSKKDVSFLLSIMGILGLFARPAFGWIGDLRWVNKTVMFGVCGVLVGVTTLATTQLVAFPRLAVVAAIFGAVNAGYIGVQGAVLVDTAGIARLEVATGIFMADIGFANFVLHISSGYILDYTGDANAPFLIFGATQVIGAILVLCVPILRRKLHRDRGFTYGGTIPMTIELSPVEGRKSIDSLPELESSSDSLPDVRFRASPVESVEIDPLYSKHCDRIPPKSNGDILTHCGLSKRHVEYKDQGGESDSSEF